MLVNWSFFLYICMYTYVWYWSHRSKIEIWYQNSAVQKNWFSKTLRFLEIHSQVDPIRSDPFIHPSILFCYFAVFFFISFLKFTFTHSFTSLHFISFHFRKWQILIFWFSLNVYFFLHILRDPNNIKYEHMFFFILFKLNIQLQTDVWKRSLKRKCSVRLCSNYCIIYLMYTFWIADDPLSFCHIPSTEQGCI